MALSEPRRVVLPLAAAALFTARDPQVSGAERSSALPAVWDDEAPGMISAPTRWTTVDDAMLRSEVIDALLEEVGVDALGIDVATKDRTVTLRGSVPSAGLRAHAARVAGAVAHVKSVTDELQITEFRV